MKSQIMNWSSAHVCTIFEYENCSCTRSLKMLRTASWSNQEHVDHSVCVTFSRTTLMNLPTVIFHRNVTSPPTVMIMMYKIYISFHPQINRHCVVLSRIPEFSSLILFILLLYCCWKWALLNYLLQGVYVVFQHLAILCILSKSYFVSLCWQV